MVFATQDTILTCALIIAVLIAAAKAAGLNLDRLQKTECDSGKQVCVQDGSCCILGEQVCSSHERTCVDVFSPGDDRKHLCCEIFNRTSTDPREGLFEACHYLYGTQDGLQQTCREERKPLTTDHRQDDVFKYGFIALVIVSICLLIAVIYCCYQRRSRRHKKLRSSFKFRKPVAKENDQNIVTQQRLIQTTHENQEHTDHVADNPAEVPSGNRNRHGSGEAGARCEMTPQRQSERLSAASPNPNGGCTHIGLVQRETDPGLSPGEERSQFNREINIDSATPHDVQPMIAPSGTKYQNE